MDRELTHDELDELLPLYALDALEGEERAQVARYVARDAAAGAEVESLREAASYLPHPPRQAPGALWAGIEQALGAPQAGSGDLRPAPLSPLPTLHAPPAPASSPRSSRPRTRVFAIAAAVLLVVAVSVSAVLGVMVAHQQDRIDALADEMHHDTVQRQAAMASSMPGAHTASLAAESGASAGKVVMLPDGSGWFVQSDLEALPAGRTYQLWAVVDDGAGGTRYVSVGVLGREPEATAFRVRRAGRCVRRVGGAGRGRNCAGSDGRAGLDGLSPGQSSRGWLSARGASPEGTGQGAVAYTVGLTTGARSSMDRASDYGSEGWGFESLRAH